MQMYEKNKSCQKVNIARRRQLSTLLWLENLIQMQLMEALSPKNKKLKFWFKFLKSRSNTQVKVTIMVPTDRYCYKEYTYNI